MERSIDRVVMNVHASRRLYRQAMNLSESTIWDRTREYAESERLYDVERLHAETVT